MPPAPIEGQDYQRHNGINWPTNNEMLQVSAAACTTSASLGQRLNGFPGVVEAPHPGW
jgi:hypothetical protein